MSFFLVYDNKGTPTIFEIEPRYRKGKKLSAKVIETGKARSFAFSMALGLFDSKAEAESLLSDFAKINEIADANTIKADKIREKANKLQEKIDKLNGQLERLEERIEKKDETYGNLEEKVELTATQEERFEKLSADIDALRDKENQLHEQISDLEEEHWKLEEEADKLEEAHFNAIDELEKGHVEASINKILALDIEEKPDNPPKKKTTPAPIHQAIERQSPNQPETELQDEQVMSPPSVQKSSIAPVLETIGGVAVIVGIIFLIFSS